MQEDKGAAFGQQRPQVVVHRVVEIAAAAAAADRDAVQPEIVQCPARFLRGARPTQRHRPQPQQPLWCVVHVPGQFLVALGDDVGGEGLGEKNWGPTEEWLPIDKVWIPGHPGLANHIAQYTLDHGFDPAFSHLLELDHGIMTVYFELDNDMKLPLVPIVQNCAVPPLVPARRAYEFGKALGDAIRSYDGLERVAVVGAGGLSHWIGNPRVGDINEEFDRWFLEVLESGDLEQVLDMPNEEIELAGNGNHEMRSWLAVAGAVSATQPKATKLAYEAVYPWITGMAVAQWETGLGETGLGEANGTAATAAAEQREESLA